ncbi:MAG: indolepyruvate ferredoxin oxidoreductase subunit alpha [Candidatus Fraserbacteria bacterium RBG_16_55_9]|uniref:Indolepyruvate oxidoreductase subunit IorA n=1 Tax=Fraserbacteria sp. (strain RBG_16_55_9) TaxID=1817864 RepID=A0A1F5UYT7_FRAXR|nr:MAG: indolepyruvate ferredoxin oxidoreductase subunit alpha [Candidatus Fraserbacteria bacterium RBG_16_55_9]
MTQLTTRERGSKMLLLGNEAIVRGALEAGVGFVTTYPGTPASEIGDAFAEIAPDAGIYFEYSVNEKVALEMAAAAAVSGVRALCAMKHVGLNVAADAFMSLAYTGVRAGLVIVSADDPSMHSSQNEQDNRYYAKLANIPMLEPADPQEALEMVRHAFELSEKLELPVLLRTTTRVNHTRGIVKIGELPKTFTKAARFVKEPSRFVVVPAVARQRHKVLIERMGQARQLSEDSPFHMIIGKAQELGIVSSGVAFNYALDAVEELDLTKRIGILKIGMTNPLPCTLCEAFLLSSERILVVEELEPYLENELKVIVADLGIHREILGKGSGHFPQLYEFTPDRVKRAIAELMGIAVEKPVAQTLPPLPARPPQLCAGCPHRATYYALKLALGDEFKNTIFTTDIGCYTLGLLPPLEMADYLLCMGSSIGTANGFTRATDQRVVALVGDSTFFHAGIPALTNAVHGQHKFLLVILDNRTTAMTGHQPHPGLEFSVTGHVPAVAIEDVLQGCGVRSIHILDPAGLQEAVDVFKEALQESKEEIAVVISRHPCVLLRSGG